MGQSTPPPDTAAPLPRCRIREEDAGAVVYVPATGEYYWATAQGADLCRLAEGGEPVEAIVEHLATRYGIPVDVARAGLAHAAGVLSGSDPADLHGKRRNASVRWIVPLQERMGRHAERCETFGMPL